MSRCPRCRNRVDPTFTTHCPECGQALVAGVDSMNVPGSGSVPTQGDRRSVSRGGRRAFTWMVRILLLLVLVFGARICSYADRLLEELPREAAVTFHRAA